jgi:hypothetical protein
MSRDGNAEARGPHRAERPDVDVTLIDAMLELDPTERLRLNDRTLDMLEELRRGLGTDQPAR